jgi:acyl carrier protein
VHLAGLKYDPEQKTASAREPTAMINGEERTHRPTSPLGTADRSGRLQRIGEHLYDIDRLANAMQEHRLPKQPLAGVVDGAPRSDLEAALARIWSTVLGRPRIGMKENFFDVGGTSLRAVQVIAMIKKELNQTLSIVNLFECPTLALLAARLKAAAPSDTGTAAIGAALRGQQRRHKTMMQHAS